MASPKPGSAFALTVGLELFEDVLEPVLRNAGTVVAHPAFNRTFRIGFRALTTTSPRGA